MTRGIRSLAGRLPDFIVVGAAKAGTSSLARYLSLHPDIHMSRPKEPNFFNDAAHYGRKRDQQPAGQQQRGGLGKRARQRGRRHRRGGRGDGQRGRRGRDPVEGQRCTERNSEGDDRNHEH